MNFGELKTRVLEYAHRPDLATSAASFVSLCEGLIRRDLQASVYTVQLADAQRVSPGGGVYTLPLTLDVVRSVRAADAGDGAQQVGLAELRRMPTSGPLAWYAVNGDTIEFRGVPGTGALVELIYFGHPVPLAADIDTNELLTNHESLYVYGSLFHLYQFTQDLELAQSALDTFGDALGKLNEAAGRKLGGARVAGAYYFGPLHRGY